MIKIDDLFNYRLTKEVQDSLLSVFDYLLHNCKNEIKDIVNNIIVRKMITENYIVTSNTVS